MGWIKAMELQVVFCVAYHTQVRLLETQKLEHGLTLISQRALVQANGTAQVSRAA